MAVVIIVIYVLLFMLLQRSRMNKIACRSGILILSFWSLCLLVSTFNPYGLFPVSPYVYVLLILNVVSFTIGFLSKRNKYKSLYAVNFDFGIDKFLSSKIYIIAMICIIVITWFLTYQQRSFVLMYNLGYLRQNFYTAMFAGKPLLAFIYVNLLQPAYELSLFLLCYLIVYNRNLKHILLLALFVIPFMFISGGRTRAMMLVFYFAFIVIGNTLFNKAKDTSSVLNFKFKHFLGVTIGFVCLFLLFSYTSVLRLGADELDKESMSAGIEKSVTQICTYCTGSFRAFEYALDHDYVENIDGFKFGRATFGGLESFMERILRHLTGLQLPNITEKTVMMLQNNEITVGNGVQSEFNYAYTNALYHYFDFGVFGVVLFPFLFGRFFKRYLDFAWANPSVYSLALVAYLFEIGIYSVFSLLTATDPASIPYILLLIYLAKQNKKSLHRVSKV